jgi:hypothetical protein
MTTIAAAMALSFASVANAATAKYRVSAQVQAACKQEAAKKFSSVHFIKRRNFANNCMAQHANAAKAKPAGHVVNKKSAPTASPTTTGQAPKQ